MKRFTRLLKKRIGFTLVEVMIGMMLMTIVSGAIYRVFNALNRSSKPIKIRIQAYRAVRLIMHRLKKEIMQAEMVKIDPVTGDLAPPGSIFSKNVTFLIYDPFGFPGIGKDDRKKKKSGGFMTYNNDPSYFYYNSIRFFKKNLQTGQNEKYEYTVKDEVLHRKVGNNIAYPLSDKIRIKDLRFLFSPLLVPDYDAQTQSFKGLVDNKMFWIRVEAEFQCAPVRGGKMPMDKLTFLVYPRLHNSSLKSNSDE